MNNKTLVLAGAGLLVAGLFTPIVTLPMVGSVSLFANGSNLLAYVIIALAGLIAFTAYSDRTTEAFFPASVALAVLVLKFIELQVMIADMKSQIAEGLADNPFAGMVEGLANAVQIQWGWLILIAGAGMAIFASLQEKKLVEEPSEPVATIKFGSLALGIAAFALVIWNSGFFSNGDLMEQSSAESGPNELGQTGDPFSAGGDEATSEKTAYIAEHLTVYDLEARYMDSLLDGRVPGVDFKVKNDGPRSLDKVKVNVIFYDENDNAIAEEDFFPVIAGGYSGDPPLRPGYIWQQERGTFYSAKSVPDEWASGKATATVTEIEFSDGSE